MEGGLMPSASRSTGARGPARKLIFRVVSWLRDGLAGREVDVIVQGLAKGFVQATALRITIIHLLVAFVSVVTRALRPEENTPVFPVLNYNHEMALPGSHCRGGPDDGFCTPGWLTGAFLGLTVGQLALLVPGCLALAVPSRLQRGLTNVVAVGDSAFIVARWAARILALFHSNTVLTALAGFALETSDVTMDVMLYGLLLASSAAPWTAWLGPIMIVLGTVIMCGREIAVNARLGLWLQWRAAAIIIVPGTWLVTTPLMEICCGVHNSLFPGQHPPFRPPYCRCRKCTHYHQRHVRHSAKEGASDERSKRSISAGSGVTGTSEQTAGGICTCEERPCIVGRMRAAVCNNLLLANLLLAVVWLLGPAGLVLAGFKITQWNQETQLRYEACRAGYSRDCHPPPLVFWDAVTPILLFFSFFITFGAAVRLARVLISHCDALLTDIMPRDVARTLVTTQALSQTRTRDLNGSTTVSGALSGPPIPSLSSPGLSSNAWPFSSLPVDPNPVLLLSVHAPAMRTLSVPAMPLRQAPGAVTEAVTGAATGAEAAPQIEEESLQSVASEGREGLEEGGSDGAEDSDGVDEGEGAGSGMAEEGVGEENGDKGNVDVTVRVPREDEGEEVGRERQQLGVRRGWSEGEHHKAHTWGRLSRRRSSLPVRPTVAVSEEIREVQGGEGFPSHVIHTHRELLKLPPLTYNHEWAEVTLMFSDLVGFTRLASGMSPHVTLKTLHALFCLLDVVSTHLRCWKYETVGDSYITAANLVRRDCRHRMASLRMAVTLISVVGQVDVARTGPGAGPGPLEARVGLHTGPVAAGVLGRKRRVMNLVGDTVNVASRMESSGLPGCVQSTMEFWQGLPNHVEGLFGDRVEEVKGKGPMPVKTLDVAAQADACRRLQLDLTQDPAVSGALLAEVGRF